jgi:hypothetical protein
MGKFSDSIQPAHQAFIEHQKMFFVASAPLSGEGHVNLSPKGMDTFRVLSPTRVAYLDITGSGLWHYSGNNGIEPIVYNGRFIIQSSFL